MSLCKPIDAHTGFSSLYKVFEELERFKTGFFNENIDCKRFNKVVYSVTDRWVGLRL